LKSIEQLKIIKQVINNFKELSAELEKCDNPDLKRKLMQFRKGEEI
jgi:hypothetical protein